MEFPAKQPAKLRPRADFQPEIFRKEIFIHGLRARWEQATECPCAVQGEDVVGSMSLMLTDTTSATIASRARSDCSVCDGRGYFWHSPQQIRAITTKAEEKVQPMESYGEYGEGMVRFTVLPEHLPGYQDRYTLLDTVLVMRETQIRGAGAVESLRYPIATRTLELEDGDRDVNVLYAHRAGLDGQTTPDDVMEPGADFEVTDDGRLDWSLGDGQGTAPEEGARYAIAYYAHPRFVVTSIPHAFRDTWTQRKKPSPEFQPLPVQVTTQLEFWAGEEA